MTKKISLSSIILALLFLFSVFACAQDAKEAPKEEVLEFAGTIIDNKSAEKYLDELSTFAPRYPKAQAVIPLSVEAGYSIYTAEGELYRFSDDSNKKIIEFLQDRNNTVQVIIEAREDEEEELELISIENRYRGVKPVRHIRKEPYHKEYEPNQKNR